MSYTLDLSSIIQSYAIVWRVDDIFDSRN